jgi:hypothetical protein
MEVDPRRLPLGDAINRLKIKLPTGIKEVVKQATPLESNLKSINGYLVGRNMKVPYILKSQEVKYPTQKYEKQRAYSKPYLKETRYEPNKYLTSKYTKPSKYEPLKKPYLPSLVYQAPKTRYQPYKKPSEYKTPYKQQPKERLPPTNINRFFEAPRRTLITPKQKRKPTRYSLLPTITQQLYRIKRKDGPVRRIRGFEIARI